MTVEKRGLQTPSEVFPSFPQVFHKGLWKEKINKNNGLATFTHIHRALLLLLILKRSLILYVLGKGRSRGKSAIIGLHTKKVRGS